VKERRLGRGAVRKEGTVSYVRLLLPTSDATVHNKLILTTLLIKENNLCKEIRNALSTLGQNMYFLRVISFELEMC